MRETYPGCDKRTTGMEDASAHMDLALDETRKISAAARNAFSNMTSNTVRLADRHFHCPGSSDIAAVMTALAAIEKAIQSLGSSRHAQSARDPSRHRLRTRAATRGQGPGGVHGSCGEEVHLF